MGVEKKPAAKAEDPKKKAEEEKKEKKEEVKEKPIPRTPESELKLSLVLVAKGVKTLQGVHISRALRKTFWLRKKMTKALLLNILNTYVPKTDNRQFLVDYVNAVVEKKTDNEMEVEGSETTPAPAAAAAASPGMEVEGATTVDDFELLPEALVFLNLLVVIFLMDNGKTKEATNVAEQNLEMIKRHNKRTMDLISSRLYYYYYIAHHRMGNPGSIRNRLLAMYRSACLHHDVPGQAVLQNAILANYLHYNMYGQAEMFINVTTPIERDNNQYARYLYYTGKINAVQLHYSDAEENLSQALRKCPKAAVGFRQTTTKLLCIVQLLMGDIPERSMFFEKDLNKSLFPYFKLTQAVRDGSLQVFTQAIKAHDSAFKKDGMSSLITRLRHNVIKTGLRKICISYSKISLASICAKLNYDSVEDIEYIVAKAIHDGVIHAVIDRKAGCLMSKENLDVYSSDEPAKVFNKRINFCLKLRNEAAMQYPPDAHKPKREKEAEEAKEAKDSKEEEEGKNKGKEKK